jgi:hypothetical protein
MLITVRQQGVETPHGARHTDRWASLELDILVGRPPGVGAPPGPGENGRCINEKTAVGLIVGAHPLTLQLKVMRPED